MPPKTNQTPLYPVDSLPVCAQEFVMGLANGLNCSPSLPATLALGVMAGAVGGMAKLLGRTARLWCLVRVDDCETYTSCRWHTIGKLYEIARELIELGDLVAVDAWDNYDNLIQRSPDARVLVNINGRPQLSPLGWEDETLSCVGRMDGELWLQPSVWQKLLCADCTVDRPPLFPSAMPQAAQNSWDRALRAVLLRRIRVAGDPIQLIPNPTCERLLTQDDPDAFGLRLALISAVFRNPGLGELCVQDTDVDNACALLDWHAKAKSRLWQGARENPWGRPCFGERSHCSASPAAAEIEARLVSRHGRRLVEFGAPAEGAPDGAYLFIPHPQGVHCGLQQFKIVSGPELSGHQIRKAITALEDLASAANRHEMHWDFGIWRRQSPNGLAAFVDQGCWAAIVVWQHPIPTDDPDAAGRVIIKNLWVARRFRRTHLATKLLESISDWTSREPLFEGPFSKPGWALAEAWYSKRSTAPPNWIHTKTGLPASDAIVEPPR